MTDGRLLLQSIHYGRAMEQERATATRTPERRRRPDRRRSSDRRDGAFTAERRARSYTGGPSPRKLREIQDLVRWGAIEI